MDKHIDEFEAWNDFESLEDLDNEDLRGLLNDYAESANREELEVMVQHMRFMRFGDD